MKMRIIPRMDFDGIDFGDNRLNDRLLDSIEQMTEKPGESTLGAGEGRTNAKGFYRLLANPKFDLNLLQEQEKGMTIARMKDQKITLLIQDTTDVNLNTHKKTEGLGYCSEHVLGIKLHTCLAFTTDGFPLGVLGQSYETREKGTVDIPKSELAKRPIEEKESYRWLEMLENSTKDIPEYIETISITDREGDFYELYSKAGELTQKYIIRVAHNRRTTTGGKLIDRVHAAIPCGEFTVNIPRDSRNNKPARTAVMEVAYCNVEMLKPILRNEPDLLPAINANVVRITEKNVEDPIEWILMTNLDIEMVEDCKCVVEYYMLRW